MSHRDEDGPTRAEPSPGWVLLTIRALSSFYLWSLLGMAAWAAIPTVAGGGALVITSGSMGPHLRPGDVIVTTPEVEHPLPAGTVVTFQDPAVAGRIVTHRIVGQHDDGTYQTKGDANRGPDSTPLPPDRIIGVPWMLVPSVGLPVLWLGSGQHALFAGWAAVSALAVAGVALRPTARTQQPPAPRRRPSRHARPGRRRRAITIASLVLLVSGVPGTSHANWATTTASEGSWQGDTLPVPANTGGSLTCGSLTKDITITWDPVAADSVADGYSLYRSTTSGGPYEWRADVTGNQSTSYTDSGLDLDATEYYYVVRSAILAVTWESANSTEVHVPGCP